MLGAQVQQLSFTEASFHPLAMRPGAPGAASRPLDRPGASAYSCPEGRSRRRRRIAMKDLMGLMKQAQAMQERMQSMQAEMDEIEVEGQAGGGAVKVTMSAKGMMRGVSIDASLMNADEKEIVEDLVVAAVNDARAKGERQVQERMAEITEGLPLPPGMKLF